MKTVVDYKIEKNEWVEEQNKAFKKIVSKYTIDGFRKGKAPRSVFDKAYPGEVVRAAADSAIDKEYRRILTEGTIQPILEPNVELVSISDEALEVKFTFITEPEVTLGEYRQLDVEKEKVKVSKEEVEERIDSLLKNYAELVVKEEGVVEDKDTAVIDYRGLLDGVAFDGGTAEGYALEIGSHTFIPGFEEGVIGMKKGETKEIPLTFPEEYTADLAGKDVIFEVTVQEIKTRVVPELDEEFFEDLGMENVTNEKELKDMMKKELQDEKEQNAENKYIDALLDKAVSNMTIELDEEIVHAEAHSMYHSFMERLSMQGISEDLYLQYANTTEEKIIENMKEDATKRLKNTYLLNAIIKNENIEVSEEEATKEVTNLAEKHHMEKDELLKEIGGLEGMIYDLKVRKAIDLMKK